VVNVLPFALNLEYLEAEFYTVAATGWIIDQPHYSIGVTGQGNEGLTIGGAQVHFNNNLVFTQAVALEITQDERSHVTLFRTALTHAGIMPRAKPEIKLDALGIGFSSVASFLTLARIFEDIVVTAYAGAVQLTRLTNSLYIGTAARLLAAEAEHVGNIRLEMARLGVKSPKLDGADILPPPNGTLHISMNSQGLVETRTPGQVLYLSTEWQRQPGRLFPMGVNGALKTSSSTPARRLPAFHNLPLSVWRNQKTKRQNKPANCCGPFIGI
jgi:Ferritin-like domain